MSAFAVRVRGISIGFAALASLAVGAATAARALSASSSEQAPSKVAERVSRDRIEDAAREIDRMVRKGLEEAGLRANDRIDDETFLRRAYLQIAGRIPTLDEARAFLSSRDPDHRGELIDRLLDSPAWASRMLPFFQDLLRVKNKLNRYVPGEPYLHYLREALAENKPYDVMVRELLTAEGPALERGNGATGYYLRDRGMPEDNMANTARVFLGTRMECAQCHDHPFDRWTQREFYEMVAFTGGVDYVHDELAQTKVGAALRELAQEMKGGKGSAGRKALKRALRNVVAGVSGSGTGLAQLPKDYRYDDASPLSWVEAHPPFGPEVDLDVEPPTGKKARRAMKKAATKAKQFGYKPKQPGVAEVGSRQAYAEWMTSPQNPRFAAVIANRMWKLAMGRGLVEPVDDWRDDTRPSNPELMEYLERLMVELDFDLKQFLRVVFSTDAWQREAVAKAPPPDQPFSFPGPVMQRLSAEQMWDSLLTLAIEDVDATISDPGAYAEPYYREYEAFIEQDEDDLRRLVEEQKLRFTDKDAFKKAQARKKAGIKQRAKEIKQRIKQLRKAERKGNADQVARLRAELEQLGVDPDNPRRNLKKNASALARASELPSPAPEDHFLRMFGQSDREQIEASHTDANVPQALALLNGFVEEHLLVAGSAIETAVFSERTVRDRIRNAYLAVLSREPDPRELDQWKADVSRYGDEAYADLVWTLVNSHEFRFLR